MADSSSSSSSSSSSESAIMVSFGKYTGQPLSALLADVGYVRHLLSVPWFAKRYPDYFQLVIAAQKLNPSSSSSSSAASCASSSSYGTAAAYRDSPTPVHNRMQNRFLRPEFQHAWAAHILSGQKSSSTSSSSIKRAPLPEVSPEAKESNLKERVRTCPLHIRLSACGWRQHIPSSYADGKLTVQYESTRSQEVPEVRHVYVPLDVTVATRLHGHLKKLQYQYQNMTTNHPFTLARQAAYLVDLQRQLNDFVEEITASMPALPGGRFETKDSWERSPQQQPVLHDHILARFSKLSLPGLDDAVPDNIIVSSLALRVKCLDTIDAMLEIKGLGWGQLQWSRPPSWTIEFARCWTVQYSVSYYLDDSSNNHNREDIRVQSCRFEEQNWDVKLEVVTLPPLKTTNHIVAVVGMPQIAADEKADNKPFVQPIYIELKPVLGDDYPVALRKLKYQRVSQELLEQRWRMKDRQRQPPLFVLLVDHFESAAASEDELRQIFGQDGTRVHFLSEVHVAETKRNRNEEADSPSNKKPKI